MVNKVKGIKKPFYNPPFAGVEQDHKGLGLLPEKVLH